MSIYFNRQELNWNIEQLRKKSMFIKSVAVIIAIALGIFQALTYMLTPDIMLAYIVSMNLFYIADMYYFLQELRLESSENRVRFLHILHACTSISTIYFYMTLLLIFFTVFHNKCLLVLEILRES